MIQFLFKSRKGQFFSLAILFTVAGFVLMPIHDLASRICFYIAIFFGGFFAAKDAVVDTIREKSPNVDLLMILSALGAAAINFESEGAVLLIIFSGSDLLEEYATDKTTNEISALMSNVPETAKLVMSSGQTKEVSTEDLQLEDQVLVAKGEQVPIDGYVDSQVSIDESALTGESIPVSKEAGQEVFAGTINQGNAFQLTVSKTSDETIFSSIVKMVEEAQDHPSNIAKFIDRFETKYVITVLIAVPLFVLALYGLTANNWQEAIYRGLVLLTVASPCALVASATPATLSAISNGAKHGILVKGGAAMESLSSMDQLFTDKTGTLTFGEFTLVDYQASDQTLAYVTYMENQSNHPIARALVDHFKDLDFSQVDSSQPVEEVAGVGLKMGDWLLGKLSVFEGYKGYQELNQELENKQTTVVAAYKDEIKGYFVLADEIRQEAKEAVRNFMAAGVDVSLLTGDNETAASQVAQAIGLDHYEASLTPEDQTVFVKEAQNEETVIGMIGDGINDAPALANADIGIAMGSGSSVAMESSDLIVVKNNLAKLFYSFDLSKRLNKIIIQNIVFAVGVIVILVILNLLGILDLPTGVVAHEGSTILVILNGLRLLKTPKDADDDEVEKEEEASSVSLQA